MSRFRSSSISNLTFFHIWIYFAMLVSPWQLISILVLFICSLANSNLHELIEIPAPPMHSLDEGAERLIRGSPPVDWVDGFVHVQDRIHGIIAEAGAIQGDGCSASQTKQLSDIEGPRDGRNIASRNTPEQNDGHQNGEACRNIGAMSDVELRPLSDLEKVIQADTIGPEPDPSICENAEMPIPVCAPDQLTDDDNFASQLQRCRPRRFTSTNFR